MSPVRPGSDVWRINREAHITPQRVTPETLEVIRNSLRISERTGGCFDITFAGLSHLWNFRKKPFIPPDRNSVEKLLGGVSHKNIRIADDGRVSLLNGTTRIGLGAIAKGYAIKRGIEYLRSKGVTRAIVDAGGDLQVIGDRGRGPWRTGLMHPREKRILLVMALRDMEAVATSGDYERFAMHKGRRYHHIIDPRTGMPSCCLVSVSVLSMDAVESDAIATALFVMGRKRAVEFLSGNRARLSGILIDGDMRIYASRELQDRITEIGKEKIHWF